MTVEIPANPTGPQQLDHILTSAVVLNWDALTQASTPGRVKVEYHIGLDGSIEYLKMWGSAREYWSLICDYSAHLGWSDGPRFSNGYHSRPLARLLQSIILNQNLFWHGGKPNSNGMLEIGPPTLQETESARLRVSESFQPPVVTRSSAQVRAAVQLSPIE